MMPVRRFGFTASLILLTAAALADGTYGSGPDADGDGFHRSEDCDDTRATVFPGAPQLCDDGLNNDCDHPSWPMIVDTNELDDDFDGFNECAGDCDDQDASRRPGAVEPNDGMDNQCPGEPGFGVVDEVADLWFPSPSDNTRLCWSAQPGAFTYRLALAGAPSVAEVQCPMVLNSTCTQALQSPLPGQALFYLVRAETPRTGSWGQSSSGSEISLSCGSGSITYELSYEDRLWADDIPSSALFDFFDSMSPPPSSGYILFEDLSATGYATSFCMQRPDFYRDKYLTMALGGGLQVSGPWQKWFRLANGDWIGPETSELQNSYGQTCGRVYSWCPEAGLGGMSYWIDPAGTTNTCEVGNTAHGCLSGDRLTIRIAADRMTACGF